MSRRRIAWLPWLRRMLAIGAGCLLVGAFLGWSAGYGLIDWQWIPAMIRAVSLGGWTWAVLGALVLSTWILGRWYCSVLCPMGLMQDLAARSGRVFRKKPHPYKPMKPLGWLHFSILLIVLVPWVWGSAAAIALLDPYSLFGRFMNSMVDPTVRELNNLTARFTWSLGIHTIVPVKIYWPPWWSFLISLSVLLPVVVMAALRGRVFCNSVCPAGAMLRLISKYSLLTLQIDGSLCNRCGSCERSCKAGCIDRKAKVIDASRCVLCFNCTEVCDRAGVALRINPFWKSHFSRKKESKSNASTTNTLSGTNGLSGVVDGLFVASQDKDASWQARRRFLGTTLVGSAGLLATGFGQGRQRGAATDDFSSERLYYRYRDLLPPTLPPGAGDLRKFQQACTACQLCVNRCPTHALVPSFLKLGWAGMQQPIFDFVQGYCEFECNLCTQICPTGALTPLDLHVKKSSRIGIAHFFKRHCVVHTEGNECGACIEHCPTIAVTGKPFRADQPNLLLPEVNEDLCIGCGICEYACPVRPGAIRVEGLKTHERAEVKQSKPLENVPDLSEDFPF